MAVNIHPKDVRILMPMRVEPKDVRSVVSVVTVMVQPKSVFILMAESSA